MTIETTDWIDRYADDTPDRLDALFERVQADDGRWHLLLDMGFAPALRDRMPAAERDDAVVVLYEGVYDGDDLLAISPCLVPLPADAAARRAMLETVLRETSGRPMVSLLHGGRDTVALAAHLRGQMEASAAADGEAFLVRLADTRCLPAWLAALTPAQRRRFTDGIDAWHVFDRTGALVALDFDTVGEAAGGEADAGRSGEPYLLDDEQIERLRQAAKIDTLIFHVRQRPESFGRLVATPSQAHACVSAAWARHDGSPAAASRAALDALVAAGYLVTERAPVASSA
ncbi:DUF4123 domain-containing protein [Burkholderia sp. AU42008]|uniref:DUF4123 domain-containing protein n=1 Tax=unclassified Burkholderia TaxID=2613784 RepID=UPI000B7A4DFA|nr:MULTISPECIES: DUF4123 domain-containing protein [unclassified Burkholderia]MBR8233488.1 DUF4123 domain-containing protein [Burkholderia sp. AU32357]MBY4873227.1 DUF4123 domain-containing protein [Burkholderia sp. AU42008]OXI44764.1 hypothetical protein CFB49_06730 [Burkholderia sp. AU17457]